MSHESWLLPYMKSRVRDELAIDIGANEGQFTGFLASEYEKVLAFEPHPEAYKRLVAGLVGKHNVEIRNQAVFDTDGELELFLYKNSVHTSIYPYRGSKDVLNRLGIAPASSETTNKSVKVPSVKLDSLMLDRVSFIKIDTEGSEVKIIKGALVTLEYFKPRLLIEIHSMEAGKEIREILVNYDWTVILHPHYPIGSPLKKEHYWLFGEYMEHKTPVQWGGFNPSGVYPWVAA